MMEMTPFIMVLSKWQMAVDEDCGGTIDEGTVILTMMVMDIPKQMVIVMIRQPRSPGNGESCSTSIDDNLQW